MDQAGATLPDSKGRAFAIGPSLKYDNAKGWFITAKWQREMSVRNRPRRQCSVDQDDPALLNSGDES